MDKEKQRGLLLALRSELVGKLHTQPFTIYNDKTIEYLIEAQPQSLEELKEVNGFPEHGKRFKGFGESIIQIFNETVCVEEIKTESLSDGSIKITTVAKPMNSFS